MPLSIAIVTSAPRQRQSASISGEADETDRPPIPKLAIEMEAAGAPSGRPPERTRKTLQERSVFFQAFNHAPKRVRKDFQERSTFFQEFNATTPRSRQESMEKAGLTMGEESDSAKASRSEVAGEILMCQIDPRRIDLA